VYNPPAGGDRKETAMSFDLLATVPEIQGTKDVGENILLANLTDEYKVYAFYYPGQPVDEEFEDMLRAFGRQTGKNLLVNIGRYNDPEYDRIVSAFSIKKYPVLIVTAIEALAASRDEMLTLYARLDSELLLTSPERALKCLEDLFNLFLQGKVEEAVSHAKWAQRAEALRTLGGIFRTVLSKITGLVFDRDISISFAQVKLELKKHEANSH
jgi:hypothetical protein